MRKEVGFAIVAGVSIGLIIAFGAWKVTQLLKKNRSSIVDVKKNVPSQNNIGLSVSNLYAFDVITQNPFKLSGIAKPNSQIVISTTESDYLTKSIEDGSFETEIDLPAGLSELKINGQKIPVVFSLEFEKYLEEASQLEMENRKEGIDTSDFLVRLANAALKHAEVITYISGIAPDDAKPKLVEVLESPKKVYWNSYNLLLDKHLKPPGNPFGWQ